MNLLKFFLILLLNFLLFFGFSSCEKNEELEGENLFIDNNIENIDILEGKFLEKNNNLDNGYEFNSEDFFDGAEFEDVLGNDLGASILNGVSMDGNYFNVSTGVDLHKITGYIDFLEGTFEKNGKYYSLNPTYGDKINGLKIAFANSSTNLIFNSISFGGYGMENVGIINGKTQFNIYFDGNDLSQRAKKVGNIFTSEEDFLTQVKFSQEKKDGDEYISAKIHTKVVSQIAKNEEGGLLFDWPCLTSDFTYVESDFRNNGEIFSSNYYEETNTGYVLSSDWKNGNLEERVIFNGGLCALNDTYNFVKGAVVGSQCWGGESDNDVGRLVFRPHKDSFCNMAGSIADEKFYPEYACNILTEKIGDSHDVQGYLGGDEFSLYGNKYTCGE